MLDLIHLDCETHPVTMDEPAPAPVCMQWCVGPAPILRQGPPAPLITYVPGGPVHSQIPGGDAHLEDEDPSWRWPKWSIADQLGPAPAEEATEDDDPADDFRQRTAIDEALEPRLLGRADLLDAFRWALVETDMLICGVNPSYDLLVLLREAKRRGLDLWRKVMDMLAAGRLRATDVSDKLLCIAQGREEHKFGMEALAWRYMGIKLGDAKHGPHAWRLRYPELERWPEDDEAAWIAAVQTGVVTPSQLAGVRDGTLAAEPGGPRPVETLPYHARRYALGDVAIDREIYRRQRDVALRLFGKPEIPDEVARPVFQFCLYLQSTTGVRTDYDMACAARASLADASDRLMAVLVKAGLVNRKEVWTGADMVPKGTVLACTDRPGETFRFVERCDVKGKPNPRGRSATVEREEDDTPERLPVASLHVVEDMGAGLHLSRDMKEVRRRVEEALRADGYSDRLDSAPPSPAFTLTEQPGRSTTARLLAGAFKEIPRTETGLIKTDREVLDLVCGMTDDAGLRALGALGKAQKLQSTYVEPLCRERTVRWRYDVLKDTGRTSASGLRFLAPSDEGVLISLKEGTNFQNFPGRDALARTARAVAANLGLLTGDSLKDDLWVSDWVRRHDPRRMVMARPGRLFVNHDYKAIELACMARVLNVFSKSPSSLAAVVNSGKDPHLWTGVWVHPIMHRGETLTYEELQAVKDSVELAGAPEWSLTPDQKQALQDAFKAAKRLGDSLAAIQKRVAKTRKMCKVVNFGFLGAMGAAKFILYAWQGYGERVEMDIAKALRKAFLSAYPEVRDYFERISELQRRDMPVVQLGTGRVRRGCTYAAACNSYFQGLAADGGAQAAWLLAWQCKVGPGPLFDSQADVLIFEHDAYLLEFLHEAAEEWQWLDAELERAALRGAANTDPAIIDLAARRETLRKDAQTCPVALELGRLMVAGMEVYLKDPKRPELSVAVGTDGKVSTRWEK